MFTPSGFKDVGVKKLEFVANTQFFRQFCFNQWECWKVWLAINPRVQLIL